MFDQACAILAKVEEGYREGILLGEVKAAKTEIIRCGVKENSKSRYIKNKASGAWFSASR